MNPEQLRQIEHLIFDMDGVLWRGETPLPGLPAFFEQLQQLGIAYQFATNNASKTPQQYIEKFARFGVAITEEQVMSSALATASYMREAFDPAGTAVYVIGGDGLHAAIAEQGFRILAMDDYTTPARVVAVGFTRDVLYDHFAVANIHLRQHKATYIGSNPDLTYPHELGQLPGAGSLIKLLEVASDVTPKIIGKPFPTMFEQSLRRFGPQATGENTAMVGDRLGTDIAGARAAGLLSVLVLTGVTHPDELADTPHQPTAVYDDIFALGAALEAAR